MPDDQIQRATVYSGESLLLRWGDSQKGRTVTLQLDPHVGNEHPFKGLKCGENGQRVAIVAVLIADDESPQPNAAGAQRSASKPAEPKPHRTWTRGQQCAYQCSHPTFIEWLGGDTEADAEEILKTKLGIKSRSELNTNDIAWKHWERIQASYEMGEPYSP